jgi:hypothetical protein
LEAVGKKVSQKKIVSTFEKNNTSETFRKGIRNYWTQTETAFDIAAKGLDDEWESYVSNLRDVIEGYDVNEIQKKIAILKTLSDFFDNIPL